MKLFQLFFLGFVLSSCVSAPKKTIPPVKNIQPVKKPPQLSFIWPVKRPDITSYFGWRSKKRMHEGIDLGKRSGRFIYASESGVVIHNGWLRGFGRVIILKHKYEWSTLYAHLASTKVKRGQYVPKGAYIADMGRTGRATGTHLHFEVRKGADPLDPLLFLPRLQ